ncbi:MAG: 50S ribosomal protein L13 [Candidatus Diapherotrites archaeon]|nr:50S ribosomal protein L13 [Candidatus Diapherotrites archaeon]
MIINAEKLVLGRLASKAAKLALKGEEVTIVNAEKAVVVGNKNTIIEKFKKRIDLSPKGNPRKGPKFPRTPDRILRRAIRGMLPYKKYRGKKAYRKVKVYIGIPEELKDKEKEFKTIEEAKYKSVKEALTLGELSKALGAKERW